MLLVLGSVDGVGSFSFCREYGGSVVSLCSFGLVVKMVEVLSVLVVLVVLS